MPGSTKSNIEDICKKLRESQMNKRRGRNPSESMNTKELMQHFLKQSKENPLGGLNRDGSKSKLRVGRNSSIGGSILSRKSMESSEWGSKLKGIS